MRSGGQCEGARWLPAVAWTDWSRIHLGDVGSREQQALVRRGAGPPRPEEHLLRAGAAGLLRCVKVVPEAEGSHPIPQRWVQRTQRERRAFEVAVGCRGPR